DVDAAVHDVDVDVDVDVHASYTLRHEVVGGLSIRFWKDNWVGNGPLFSSRQNIGSRNEAALKDMVSELGQVYLSNLPNAWSWNISDDGNFSLQAMIIHINNWRLILDRLSNRLNLSSQRLQIISIACPSCNSGVESNDHVFLDVIRLATSSVLLECGPILIWLPFPLGSIGWIGSMI
ncbi:hypothetical protein Tco_1137961, partial [Tanacetum coccineum]